MRVARISTYKVGWEEWGRNCHSCVPLTRALLRLFLPCPSASLLFFSAYQLLNSTPNLLSSLPPHSIPYLSLQSGEADWLIGSVVLFCCVVDWSFSLVLHRLLFLHFLSTFLLLSLNISLPITPLYSGEVIFRCGVEVVDWFPGFWVVFFTFFLSFMRKRSKMSCVDGGGLSPALPLSILPTLIVDVVSCWIGCMLDW